MDVLHVILQVLLGITSLLLTLLILLHKGRGGGLSDMFGGGMSSGLSSSGVAERNLNRFTVILGITWGVVIIGLGLIMRFSAAATPRTPFRKTSYGVLVALPASGTPNYTVADCTRIPSSQVARSSRCCIPPPDSGESVWEPPKGPRPATNRSTAPRVRTAPYPRHLPLRQGPRNPAGLRPAARRTDPRSLGLPALRRDRHPGRGAVRPRGNPGGGFKSHLEYVKERRSSQDAEDVLAGALERLRARRGFPEDSAGDRAVG